jgi:hypothetical protein
MSRQSSATATQPHPTRTSSIKQPHLQLRHIDECSAQAPSLIEAHPHGALSLNKPDEPKASTVFGSSLALSSVWTSFDSRSEPGEATTENPTLLLHLSAATRPSSSSSSIEGVVNVSRGHEDKHSHLPAISADRSIPIPIPIPSPRSRRTQNTALLFDLQSSLEHHPMPSNNRCSGTTC